VVLAPQLKRLVCGSTLAVRGLRIGLDAKPRAIRRESVLKRQLQVVVTHPFVPSLWERIFQTDTSVDPVGRAIGLDFRSSQIVGAVVSEPFRPQRYGHNRYRENPPSSRHPWYAHAPVLARMMSVSTFGLSYRRKGQV